ncbi:protein SYS1, putative [Plasmodium malariae]|uniref:Protein SYS1, putative n=1 Tax=Plasmodium malariae TaxID=5858 RepID=A0A1D3SMU1_PLAMA|nr:protein SYS1, putative [Plasmodium malariae]SCO93171.1 protein SYS1, putative [Plasmodium malariae]
MKILSYIQQENGRFILDTPENHVHFIIWQILCLQAVFYAIPSTTTFFIFTIAGFFRNLIYIFNTESYFNGDIALFCIFFTNILNSVLISLFIKIVVKRSKKHLDYVTSYGIIHLCLSIVVSRFPVSYLWYLSFFLFVMITVLISECLCYKDNIERNLFEQHYIVRSNYNVYFYNTQKL